MDERKEKDLGEALGLVLIDLGWTSGAVINGLGLLAVEAAAWGPRFAAYIVFEQERRAQREAMKKNPAGAPPVDPPAAAAPARAEDPYTSKPGLL